jgi:PAS domain S-box-containing protein
MKTPDADDVRDLALARDVLRGGGEMGALMRSMDWSKTAVGPAEDWPQSLRTALSILLETGFPMYIAWGADFTQFYNDGYRPILGSTKHPAAMGISTRRTFAEIWDIIGPMFEGVMRGTPVMVHDFHLPLDRHGFVEECYFVFSYSPIREETGRIGGVLVTVTETTDRVLGERRLTILQDLGAAAQKATDADVACRIAVDVLALDPKDVPFAAIYLLDDEHRHARLAGYSGLPAGTPLLPASCDLAGDRPWPFDLLVNVRQPETIALPPRPTRGDPSELPERAQVVPIVTPGVDRPAGVLVAGLSPHLAFDDKYRSFLALVAGHIGSAVARARALAEAKARADTLAEIDRAKTAFFSNVSHEFRTPLTLMLGPADDALASDTLAPEDRERWSLVQRNALRLSKLVNTLLDFSRIEAGRVEASYEPVDLAVLTGELASMFRSAVERAGLALRLSLPSLGEPVYVDRDMWEKIVLNLLSNALKFTFEGEIAVALSIVDRQVELVVRDTGIGMAAEDVAQLFDRFHRVKGARARTHEGTGIGLALVAELAKLHGGTVRAESVEGRGTAFYVRVPQGRAHLAEDRIGAARVLPSTGPRADAFVEEALRWIEPAVTLSPQPEPAGEDATGRERIVLADDNADMRAYLGRLLRERWDVEAVADGAAALEAIRRAPPDLVLSDVMMPVVDGFELLRTVRNDPALRLLPVILLSARAGEEATNEGLAAGADDYIVKPFSARELLVRVASKLAVVKVAREAREIEESAREELSRLLAKAEASERQFRQLVENLPELAWTAEPDGFIDYYNQRWFEYTGASFEEMRGSGWKSLHDPDKFEEVMERWRHSIDTGEPFEMEFPLRGSDGVFRWFLTRVRPLRDENGRIVKWFGSSTNIDDRRRSDAFKETFLGILGHDLRNPLSTILITSRVLALRDDTPSETRRRLERVTTSGLRMQQMIEQLLDMTRARLAGGITVALTEREVDLSGVVKKIVDEVQTAQPQSRLELLVDGDCSARVDADRFEQVVSNLLGNAVTHGDPAKPVRVHLLSRADAIVMTVHNHGPAIDRAFMPLLFNPFARGERPQRHSAGLGLGLYISERIIDAHGGTLTAHSSEVAGTSFEVVLPRKE